MLAIFNSKKGVSPLIATILLIAFAVALGSVIMNWGLNFNIGKENDICGKVGIKIRSLDAAEVCYSGLGVNGYINFILDNIGSSDVNGLSIWIIGEKGTRLFDLDRITLKKGVLFDKRDMDVSYDFNVYGKIREVQFIPKVQSSKGQEVCTTSAVKTQKIGICSK